MFHHCLRALLVILLVENVLYLYVEIQHWSKKDTEIDLTQEAKQNEVNAVAMDTSVPRLSSAKFNSDGVDNPAYRLISYYVNMYKMSINCTFLTGHTLLMI